MAILLRSLGETLLRAVGAAIASVGAIAFAMLAGFFGGSGGNGVSAAAFIALFAAGWSLLPAIRGSFVFALFSAGAWGFLGYKLSQFGAEHVRGWMFGPWVLATLGVLVCLAIKPPAYIHRMVTRSQSPSSDAKDA